MTMGLHDIQAAVHSIKVSDGTNDLLIDGSGHISINDGGNSITVDNADLSTIAGAVDGTEMQVDIVSAPTLTVQATALDIRALTASDVVTIVDGGGSITVDGTVSTVSGGYSQWKVSAATVSNAAESELASTPLVGRLAVLIQNLSNNNIYIKEATGVSVANGALLPKKGYYEAELDDGADIFAIADSGTTNDVRIVEYAA